jgi:hypothetical protein
MTYSVEVGIGVLGHVVVEDDVDTLNVHSTAEEVSGNKDARLEALEVRVLGKTGEMVRGVNRKKKTNGRKGMRGEMTPVNTKHKRTAPPASCQSVWRSRGSGARRGAG